MRVTTEFGCYTLIGLRSPLSDTAAPAWSATSATDVVLRGIARVRHMSEDTAWGPDTQDVMAGWQDSGLGSARVWRPVGAFRISKGVLWFRFCEGETSVLTERGFGIDLQHGWERTTLMSVDIIAGAKAASALAAQMGWRRAA